MKLPCLISGAVAMLVISMCAWGVEPQSPASASGVTIGQKLEVQSAALKQSRSLTVSLPERYESRADRYPVLYLLDGESNFAFTASLVRFLADAGRIPEMIVIGIDSGDFARRTHDLTPPSENEIDNRFLRGNGGADAFLAFLADELIPYVEQKYRTRPVRILIGHSFGGLFAIHTLVSRPPLFNAYIAIDPTVSWNNEIEIARVEQLLAQSKELPVEVFITAANDLGSVTPSIRHLVAALDGKTPRGFRWHFEWMEQEDHISIPLRGVYSGLNTIFAGWHLTNPLQLFDEGGISAVQKHFQDGGNRFGYQLTAPPLTISLVVAGLIRAGRLEEAATVLLHDPKAYPPPWNQLDALARAYSDIGNTEQAIRFYQLSLKQNPDNNSAKRKLKELGIQPTSSTTPEHGHKAP